MLSMAPGPSTALTQEEESELADNGFPLTANMARGFAWAVSLRSSAHGRFNEELGPGKHWWSNFRARHPELSLHTADNLKRSRVS